MSGFYKVDDGMALNSGSPHALPYLTYLTLPTYLTYIYGFPFPNRCIFHLQIVLMGFRNVLGREVFISVGHVTLLSGSDGNRIQASKQASCLRMEWMSGRSQRDRGCLTWLSGGA